MMTLIFWIVPVLSVVSNLSIYGYALGMDVKYGGDRQYFDGWHIYPVGKLYVEESSELYGGDQTSMDLEQ